MHVFSKVDEDIARGCMRSLHDTLHRNMSHGRTQLCALPPRLQHNTRRKHPRVKPEETNLLWLCSLVLSASSLLPLCFLSPSSRLWMMGSQRTDAAAAAAAAGTRCERRLPWWCEVHGRTAHVIAPGAAPSCGGQEAAQRGRMRVSPTAPPPGPRGPAGNCVSSVGHDHAGVYLRVCHQQWGSTARCVSLNGNTHTHTHTSTTNRISYKTIYLSAAKFSSVVNLYWRIET